MNPKWHELHYAVLGVLHELVYGTACVSDDAQGRTLTAWYYHHPAKIVEEQAERCVEKPE